MATDQDLPENLADATTPEQVSQMLKLSLNYDQQKAFDECTQGDRSVLCTGQGGTGKSWLLECIVQYFRKFPPAENKLLAVTASTGIAAFLVKGITLHKFAGVGIEETDVGEMIKRASRGVSKTYWEAVSILIIDEISMISATFFENLSLVAKSLRGSNEPFGGIRLIMFGDFLQLPPVSKIDHHSARVFHTDAWKYLDPKIMILSTIVRQRDPGFMRVLSELRYGVCTSETEKYIRSLDRELSYEDGVEPVKLFARKNTTEAYNESMLDVLTTPLVTYRSTDNGDAASLRQCPAVRSLRLKEGCQVMVIRNVSSSIVNGSVGTVVGFDSSFGPVLKKPKVKLVLPDGSFETITMNRMTWETISPRGDMMASRAQFPLILAWGVTIHKSQGQTMPRVYVDMSGIFENGQAYVAMSRCSDPANLRVSNFDKKLVTAATSCVKFYHELGADTESQLPAYSDNPPEYTEESATDVAESTSETWDNTPAPHPLLQGYTLSTEIMLGNLSLRESSNSSPLDFES